MKGVSEIAANFMPVLQEVYKKGITIRQSSLSVHPHVVSPPKKLVGFLIKFQIEALR
jgi:hypothetical protein